MTWPTWGAGYSHAPLHDVTDRPSHVCARATTKLEALSVTCEAQNLPWVTT